ncbi:hypothetical protein R0381_003645 [Jeongeupia wiesaeckerbachi]|uniref:hypothetical protein n=1 Tax=Jeongeupia wiesaeckerbachi TaxID=3051218 RepID=UPI003D805E92
MSEIKKTLYVVKGMAIKHGDALYPEGELIELADDEAKPLAQWIEPAKVPVEAKVTTKTKDSDGDKAATDTADKKDGQQ